MELGTNVGWLRSALADQGRRRNVYGTKYNNHRLNGSPDDLPRTAIGFGIFIREGGISTAVARKPVSICGQGRSCCQ